MTLYELITGLNDTQFPLFFLILLLAIIILYGTKFLLKLSAPYFFLGLLGIIIGLIVGSAISSQFTKLPGDIGVWFPPILNIFITVAFLDLFLAQGKNLTKNLSNLMPLRSDTLVNKNISGEKIIIDTSVLIDGRLDKLINTNVMSGQLIISNLVIQEMKHMTENSDSIRILKGRRGLDSLTALNENPKVRLEIINQSRKKSVDEALINLALERQGKLLTNDIALVKTANIAGLITINLSEVSESLRPITLPGEELEIFVLEEGRSKNQGVGYLTDGTMVVIQNGQKHLKQTVKVRVDKIHQTTTGTIIFAENIL